MSSSAPGGSLGRVFVLHGNGSDGNKDLEEVDEEVVVMVDDEAMAVSGWS